MQAVFLALRIGGYHRFRPESSRHGLNLYAYCANNPVTYSDPSGYACSFNAQSEENAVRENATLQADEPSRTQGNVEGGNEPGKTL